MYSPSQPHSRALPSEFKVNTLSSAIAPQLDAQGVELHLVERIRYVVMDKDAAVDSDRATPWDWTDGKDGYDVGFYETLFLRAIESVLAPLGVNTAMLNDRLTQLLPMPQMQKQVTARTTPYYGPLFAL